MTTHIEQAAVAGEQPPARVDEQLYCALTGRPISHAEAYWAPPLVTARQLVSTVVGALITAPGSLGSILFDEQPNVPYASDAREQLAARRSAEQLKLLMGLLALVAVVVLPIVWLVAR